MPETNLERNGISGNWKFRNCHLNLYLDLWAEELIVDGGLLLLSPIDELQLCVPYNCELKPVIDWRAVRA